MKKLLIDFTDGNELHVYLSSCDIINRRNILHITKQEMLQIPIMIKEMTT